MTKLTGLIAAVFTPFHEDGSLRLERVGAVVEHLMGQGVSAIFVNGSTGEGESLSLRERRDVAEAYVDVVGSRLPVIVQVGRNCIREAGELAAHAQGLGVFAIAATPPTYFPLDDPELVIDGLADIADRAPDTPLYYYHIPRLTGVPVNPLRLLEIAGERLPTLAGIKYSDPSLDLFVRCTRTLYVWPRHSSSGRPHRWQVASSDSGSGGFGLPFGGRFVAVVIVLRPSSDDRLCSGVFPVSHQVPEFGKSLGLPRFALGAPRIGVQPQVAWFAETETVGGLGAEFREVQEPRLVVNVQAAALLAEDGTASLTGIGVALAAGTLPEATAVALPLAALAIVATLVVVDRRADLML